MKGCLSVLGVLGLILGVLGFGTCVVGGRLISSANDFDAGMAKVEAASDLSFPFTPAPETKLTAERFEQAMRVREALSRALDSEAGALLAFVKGHLELDEGLKRLRGSYEKGRNALADVPALYERELTSARMSFRELVWVIETAYGHVFAAADRGDARAKAVDERLLAIAKERSLGGDNSLRILERFRDHCEASVVYFDPAAVEIVLAAGERFPGAPSPAGVRAGPLGFDVYLSERLRTTRRTR